MGMGRRTRGMRWAGGVGYWATDVGPGAWGSGSGMGRRVWGMGYKRTLVGGLMGMGLRGHGLCMRNTRAVMGCLDAKDAGAGTH